MDFEQLGNRRYKHDLENQEYGASSSTRLSSLAAFVFLSRAEWQLSMGQGWLLPSELERTPILVVSPMSSQGERTRKLQVLVPVTSNIEGSDSFLLR